MFNHLINRTSLITFVVLFLLNALLSTVIYSIGLATGFEGEPSWSWEQYGATLGGLFGDIPSLLALIGGIALFIFSFWVARKLSKSGHHNWLLVWYGIGIFGGGAIIYLWVDWSSFGFGFGPVLVLLAFTAVETLIIRLLQKRS
jgi:hypothetical protein